MKFKEYCHVESIKYPEKFPLIAVNGQDQSTP